MTTEQLSRFQRNQARLERNLKKGRMEHIAAKARVKQRDNGFTVNRGLTPLYRLYPKRHKVDGKLAGTVVLLAALAGGVLAYAIVLATK